MIALAFKYEYYILVIVHSLASPMELEYYNEPLKPEQLPPNLEIGERVVWISDEGDEHGTVKWIGILPGTSSKEKEWTVGVEFVCYFFIFCNVNAVDITQLKI